MVTLDGVTKRLDCQTALDRVTATFAPGELVALIGRSGAGKTTLLRCLSGAIPVTQGAIRFGDRNLGALDAGALRAHRARVGMISQQFNLVRRLPVLHNVLVGRLEHLAGWRSLAALGRFFDADQRAVALRCLDHVGLLPHAWQRTDTLSGGEQQRVAIAKVLAQEAAVILGDEPVASLDLANGALVMETLRRIGKGAGLTVIASLHDLEYARRYADRVVGLRQGRVVFDGPTEALTEAAVGEIFGEPPAHEVRPVPVGQVQPAWVPS
jgi:phosphonate transport system ATP-binding protein